VAGPQEGRWATAANQLTCSSGIGVRTPRPGRLGWERSAGHGHDGIFCRVWRLWRRHPTPAI